MFGANKHLVFLFGWNRFVILFLMWQHYISISVDFLDRVQQKFWLVWNIKKTQTAQERKFDLQNGATTHLNSILIDTIVSNVALICTIKSIYISSLPECYKFTLNKILNNKNAFLATWWTRVLTHLKEIFLSRPDPRPFSSLACQNNQIRLKLGAKNVCCTTAGRTEMFFLHRLCSASETSVTSCCHFSF